MVAELTSSEISELTAFEWLEPDLGFRIDVGFSRLLALVHNRTRGKKERGKEWQEFMPDWGPRDPDKLAGKVRSLGRMPGVWSEQARLKADVDQVARESRENG